MPNITSKSKPTKILPGLTLTLPAVLASSLQELVHTIRLHALCAAGALPLLVKLCVWESHGL